MRINKTSLCYLVIEAICLGWVYYMFDLYSSTPSILALLSIITILILIGISHFHINTRLSNIFRYARIGKKIFLKKKYMTINDFVQEFSKAICKEEFADEKVKNNIKRISKKLYLHKNNKYERLKEEELFFEMYYSDEEEEDVIYMDSSSFYSWLCRTSIIIP